MYTCVCVWHVSIMKLILWRLLPLLQQTYLYFLLETKSIMMRYLVSWKKIVYCKEVHLMSWFIERSLQKRWCEEKDMEIEFKYMDVKPSKTGLKNGVWLTKKTRWYNVPLFLWNCRPLRPNAICSPPPCHKDWYYFRISFNSNIWLLVVTAEVY